MQEKWATEKAAKATSAAAAAKTKKEEIFKRAEAYIKEYRDQEAQLVQLKRAARKAGTFYVEPEAKLLFVMRLRGINGMDPKTRKIMQVLRLLQINNGVFMRVNKATMNMLVKVDPYIMYGYPSLKTVKELVYKRGYAKVSGQRVALTENSIIEDALSEKTKGSIICMEDLMHEIPVAFQDELPCRRFLPHPPPLRRGRRRRQPGRVCQRAYREDALEAAGCFRACLCTSPLLVLCRHRWT